MVYMIPLLNPQKIITIQGFSGTAELLNVHRVNVRTVASACAERGNKPGANTKLGVNKQLVFMAFSMAFLDYKWSNGLLKDA